MAMEKIGILGAGGQADEVVSYQDSEIAFAAVNSEYISNPNMIDIENPTEDQKIESVIAAVGAPAVRKKMVESWAGDNFVNVISDNAIINQQSLEKMGKGCIVAPRAVLTTNVEVGNHVLINVAATINHNSKIGDYVTISPGVHVGGNVEIGEGAFIGIGAIISNNIKVASGVVLGAGAVLVRNAEQENGVYYGNPARLEKINDGWLSEI